MSNFALNITLNGSDFTELGLPLFPKPAKEVKESIPHLKGKVKSDYDLYVQSEERSKYDVKFAIEDILKGTCGESGIAFSLDYEKGIPHTYKFLGMDITDEYQAVIPVGDGYVVVAEMFDRNAIFNTPCEFNGQSLLYGIEPSEFEMSTRFLKSCSSEFARKVSTSMKSGSLYEAYKEAVTSDSSTISPELIFKLVDIVEEYFGQSSPDNPLSFKSILLNLVHEAKNKKDELSTGSSVSKGAAQATLIQLFCYWHEVLKRYTTIHKALSSIDLWQSVGKRLVGDTDFNSRLKDSIYLTNASGKVPGVASVSGVARNWDILDTNTNREAAVSSFKALVRKVAEPNRSVQQDNIKDLMLSNIEWEDFENPYNLDAEELQAVANYDSLKFIDEDVKVHAEAYDLDDPVERGMFIKSVAKSYDRNLRSYQAKEDYSSDLLDSMSELVDKRNEIKAGLASDTTSFTANQDSDDDSTYNVTSSINELDAAETKKVMLKVAKLIRKNLENINKSF